VTGASRGLGKSMAECLSKEGASLVINSRKEEELEALLSSLDHPEKHTYFCEDLSSEKGPSRLLDFLEQKRIEPDIVVHNVGGNLNITSPFCPLDEWRKVMRINVEVPIELN